MPRKSKYSQEFRDTALQLAEACTKPVAQVAKELGIDKHLLYDWMKAVGRKQKTSPQTRQQSQEPSAEL